MTEPWSELSNTRLTPDQRDKVRAIRSKPWHYSRTQGEERLHRDGDDRQGAKQRPQPVNNRGTEGGQKKKHWARRTYGLDDAKLD